MTGFNTVASGEIFTRQDALALGLSSWDLTGLVRSGAIVRLAQGVYQAGVTPSLQAAEISRAMRVVISHTSAAAWWGANLPTPPLAFTTTAPRRRRPRRRLPAGLRVARADLDPDEVVERGDARITVPSRTILDVARSLPLRDAVAIGDSLCRVTGTPPEDVVRAADRLAPGRGRPAAVEVASLIDPRAESVFESFSRVAMARAGLPSPTPQLNVFTAAGVWIARVDFAWEDARLVLECDGYEYHKSREAFERDRRRWAALVRAGWRVISITWTDIATDPSYLVDLIADLLGAPPAKSTYNAAA